MPYKISAVLYGHKADVRGVAVTRDGCIVSCSRDKTAKLWTPNQHNTGFTETQNFCGHKSFVTCICVVPANEVFPRALILTGSNDKIILAFTPDSSDPIFQLIGHENTVCKIVVGLEQNTILSASWDKTVKVWKLSQTGGTCVLTISKHDAAVWTVLQAKEDLIITGSADKTIKYFQPNGNLVKTLTGHTDCVRDIAKRNDDELLSCANDATVRRWLLKSGECIETLYGHPNFIYSLFVRGDQFVTTGEDRCVMVWAEGDQEKITLPAQSVWAGAILPNTDIVTASSDGIIRVFSAFAERQADEEAQAVFQSEVAALQTQAEQHLGGIKVSDLPGLESLEEPGTKEGQTRLVREGGEVNCYSWSIAEKKWNKLGNVVSGSGGTQETSGKVLYEGKEYDFVFDVDFDDDKPLLKLPFNKSEDPWHVAQKFIHQHGLPQDYLEQVANFIIRNSKLNTNSIEPPPAHYTDPFTGGNRYVPGGTTSTTGNQADPFTGGSRYVPMEVVSEPEKNAFFPQTTYLKFEQANISQIMDKLISFNNSLNDESLKFPENELKNVAKLCDPANRNYSPHTVEILKKLLNWPKDCVFPVLDILRLAVRNEDVNNLICSDKFTFGYLKDNLQSDSSAVNQMLSLRTLSNMLMHKSGEEVICSHKDFLIETIGAICNLSNKSLQIALVTLALNLSTLFFKKKDVESQSVILLNLIHIFPQLTDAEAVLRALVTFGTIFTQSGELSSCVDSNLKELISNCLNNSSEKVQACSKCVLNLIP